LWIPLIPGWAEGCVGDVFAKVEFKCPLAAASGSCELERDVKREMVVKAGLTVKP